MIRLTHDKMATVFQITAIIFIFTYTATPVQNKQSTIKTLQVAEPYKTEKSLMPQIKTISHSFNTLKNNSSVNHNFSWRTAQSDMLPDNRFESKRDNIIPAIASFSNFNQPVNN